MAVTTSTRSPADIANQALTRMGFKLRIGSLLDGSDHARHVIELYGITRDEMLEAFDYDFAERTAVLALLKSAPANGYFPPTVWNPANNPPVGFLWEYAFPSDAIKIRSIKYQPLYNVNFDPQPNTWTEYNDNYYALPQRTILTNVPGAIAVYTGRVTDPGTWAPSFSDALAARLSVLLGPSLVGLDAAKQTMPEAQMADAVSVTEQR